MIAPLLLLLLALIVYPLTQLAALGFDPAHITSSFRRLAADSAFRNSVAVTLIFVAVGVGIQLVLGLIMALTVSSVQSAVIRAVLLLPMMVAPIAVGLIWRIIYQPGFGVLNLTLRRLGLAPQGWLADPDLALASVIVVDIWQWTPFVYLILLAWLQGLPKDPFEAAIIDGANRFQVAWYITIPLLMPAIYIAVLFRTIDAFKVLDKFVTLTAGGPGGATEVLSLYIYKVSFRFLELNYGALLAIIAAIVVIVYVLAYNRFFAARSAQ